jgi:hypothetical protein
MVRTISGNPKSSAKTQPTAAAVEAASPAPVTAGSSEALRSVDRQQRQAMIAEAAYFRAQLRGFAPGGEEADWLAAEDEVNRRLLAP